MIVAPESVDPRDLPKENYCGLQLQKWRQQRRGVYEDRENEAVECLDSLSSCTVGILEFVCLDFPFGKSQKDRLTFVSFCNATKC